MNKKILITIIIVLVLIAASVILVFGYYFIQNQKKINVEDFVRSYLTKTQNFDGLDGQINGIKIKIDYSEGFAKNLWTVGLFMKEKTRDFGNHMLKEANNLKKLNVSNTLADLNKYLDEEIKIIKEQQSNIHQSISDIKIKTLEKNDISAKIQANYSRYVKDFNGEQKTKEELVYVLNFINGDWKIIDLIDKDGVWSKTMDYVKEKEDFIISLNAEESKFNQMIFNSRSLIGKIIAEENYKEPKISRSVIWQETFETGSQWTGKNSQIILQDSSNAVIRITSSPNSEGYIFKRITIPKDAYYMTYEIKNEKAALGNFLTVTFNNEIISYEALAKVDNEMRKSLDIFVGDGAGKTDDLLFTVNQVGDKESSVLIDNIIFYKITSTLP